MKTKMVWKNWKEDEAFTNSIIAVTYSRSKMTFFQCQTSNLKWIMIEHIVRWRYKEAYISRACFKSSVIKCRETFRHIKYNIFDAKIYFSLVIKASDVQYLLQVVKGEVDVLGLSELLPIQASLADSIWSGQVHQVELGAAHGGWARLPSAHVHSENTVGTCRCLVHGSLGTTEIE